MKKLNKNKFILGIPYSSYQEKGDYKIYKTFFGILKKKKSYMYSKYYFLGIQIWSKKKSKMSILMDQMHDLQDQMQEINKSLNIQQQNISSLQREILDKNNEVKFYTENAVNNLLRQNQISTLARAEHSKVFPKYKNCNLGKEIVILASGPTLDFYTKMEGKLHLGVNKTFLSNKADLDYLFVQDYIEDIQTQMDNYKGNNCKKFYGVHYLVPGIAQCHADIANAERYYFIDCNYNATWAYPPDISVMPFNTYSSVVHPAVIFALWTGVSKIYLVGCDTNLNGYSKTMPYKDYNNTLSVDNVLYGWEKLKKYAQEFYPNTEIISINPVGLKGMFKDVYTANYLEANTNCKL